ncbi:MAG: hypothetical protein JWN90_413 [Parcubacteria group bacterium]|nr:hypothetical protein [Parcubacteria group bacterium]
MKIHPIVVGIINAVLPGAGYLVIRERMIFGGLLLAGSVVALLLGFVEPVYIPNTLLVSSTLPGRGLEGIWYLLFMLAYGYDAYSIADAKRKALLPMVV